MNISVIGSGHVGLVTGACFADLGNNVICVDNDSKKIDSLKKGEVPFYEPGLEEIVKRNNENGRLKYTTEIKTGIENSSIIFITVGTPPKVNGEANLVYVENVATDIAEVMEEYKLIVEKSTVPVHTSEWIKHTINLNLNESIEFDVASNPEFLSEGNAVNDFLEPDRVVIGVNSPKSENLLKELYKPLDTSIIVTDINSAELIKHASNSFLATKISFINAVSEICEKTGADVKKVAKGMGLDSRIGRKFLKAGIGYGGSCFPKDVNAFIHIAESNSCNFNILKSVKKINETQKESFVEKIKKNLWVLEGKNIGIWGLSFKPGTDDIRNAPSIDIIKKLLEEKVNIKAYDPQAMREAKNLFDKVEFCKNVYETAKNSDCILILTEWNEFKEVDLNKIKNLLNQPLVIDGRNIYNLEKMQDLGYKYIPTGRPAIGVESN